MGQLTVGKFNDEIIATPEARAARAGLSNRYRITYTSYLHAKADAFDLSNGYTTKKSPTISRTLTRLNQPQTTWQSPPAFS